MRRSVVPSPSSRAAWRSPRAAADRPDQLYLALRGSGQALYVGLTDDHFIVASEPYGVVEETTHFLRDGRRVVVAVGQPRPGVRARRHRRRASSRACAGWPTTEASCPLTDRDIATAQVTTRDIDRGDSPHYLLKEISEAPASFRKTHPRQDRRGRRFAPGNGRRPGAARRDPPPGSPSGTHQEDQGDRPGYGGGGRPQHGGDARHRSSDGQLDIDPITATELSGFGMRLDMSDTLIVAVSQSGTTTDTNRTVDLVRGRGAAVLGDRQPAQQRPHRQGRRRDVHE